MRSASALLVMLALGVAGCGPIESVAVIIKADVELEAARNAGAESHAPYEYYSAEAYLQKAREEHGYADFQRSVDFGRKAVELAKEARTKAQARPGDDQAEPVRERVPYRPGEAPGDR